MFSDLVLFKQLRSHVFFFYNFFELSLTIIGLVRFLHNFLSKKSSEGRWRGNSGARNIGGS